LRNMMKEFRVGQRDREVSNKYDERDGGIKR
jgi:hypothetical protein